MTERPVKGEVVAAAEEDAVAVVVAVAERAVADAVADAEAGEEGLGVVHEGAGPVEGICWAVPGGWLWRLKRVSPFFEARRRRQPSRSHAVATASN